MSNVVDFQDKSKQKTTNKFKNTQTFVKYFIDKFNVTVDLDENILCHDAKEFKEPEIFMYRTLEDEVGAAQKIVNTRNMINEFNYEIKRMKDFNRSQQIEKIMKYKKDENKNLEKLVNLIYPEDFKDEFEDRDIKRKKRMAAYFIIRNFIAQNKLKESDTHHFYPVMPIFCGPGHGMGKSKIVDGLLKPLKSCRAKISLSMLTDERCTPMRGEYKIFQCDEMQGAGKSDVEVFKGVITEDYSSYKPHYTHKLVKVKNYCTAIGTSNKFSFETIKDTTGNRRVFDIDVMYKIDIPELEKIDFLAIWQDVDVKNETYDKLNSTYEEVIYPVQASNKCSSVIDEFVEIFEIDKGNKWVSYKALDHAWIEFCKQYNYNERTKMSELHMIIINSKMLYPASKQKGTFGIRVSEKSAANIFNVLNVLSS